MGLGREEAQGYRMTTRRIIGLLIIGIGSSALPSYSAVTYRPDKPQAESLQVSGGGKEAEAFRVAFVAKFLDQDNTPVVGLTFKVTLGDQDSSGQLLTYSGGTALVALNSEAKIRRSATSMDSLTLEFTDNWQSELAEKGDAIETIPARISMFLKCKKGACLIEAEDHQPLKDFIFRVNRIKHLNQAQKEAYAKQQAQAQTELEAHNRREAQLEAQAAREAQADAESKRAEVLRRQERQDEAHSKSLEDARAASNSRVREYVKTKCVFAAAFAWPEPGQISSNTKDLMSRTGARSGDIISERFFCVFDGTKGAGTIREKSGCAIAVLDGEGSYNSIFGRESGPMPMIEAKSCSKQTIEKLLSTTFKSETGSDVPYNIQGCPALNLWEVYGKCAASGMSSTIDAPVKVRVIYNKFRINTP